MIEHHPHSLVSTPLRSVIPGIGWPAIPENAGAHLLASCFQLEHSQWWTPEQLRQQQLKQLQALMQHAVETVPFYQQKHHREWFRIWSNAPEHEQWQLFRTFPILTRTMAQQATENLRSVLLPPHHGQPAEGRTSGSTGIPLRYWTTPLAQAFWNAIVMRDHFWHRRDFAKRHAFIRTSDMPLSTGWGTPSNLLFSAGESAVISAHKPSSEQLQWLIEFAPDYLMAFPASLTALAQLSIQSGIRLPRLREVRTIASTVTDSLRTLVKMAWGVSITDLYSSSDCGMLALQCPDSEGYHGQSEVVILEILDADGNDCAPGEIGRVIATPLHNFAMPLIRFDTGDFAQVGEQCPCGRGLPKIDRIVGRKANRLHLPNGGTTWPLVTRLDWHRIAPTITRYQLRQLTDFSLLLVYDAAEPLSNETMISIRSTLLTHLGHTLPINFEHAPGLALSSTGKLEDFVSAIRDTADA